MSSCLPKAALAPALEWQVLQKRALVTLWSAALQEKVRGQGLFVRLMQDDGM